MKDDVLRPASTRSKIVINLDTTDGYKYKIDPYDKVRMKLLRPNKELYLAYEATIEQLQENSKFQPKKK